MMMFRSNGTVRRLQGAVSARRSGFTLIEVLAAVAILIILVGIVAAIFAESDRAWHLGTGRVMNNNEGRAALTMIGHDLQYAVADNVLSFKIGPGWQSSTVIKDGADSYVFTNSEIACVSLQHDSSGDAPRTAREIYYYVRQWDVSTALGRTYKAYELVRHYYGKEIADINDSDDHCYETNSWYRDLGLPSAGGPVAENIAGFAAYAGVPKPGGGWELVSEYESVNYSNTLPAYVDIYLEVLNERDAAEVAKMWEASKRTEAREYIERNAKRYTSRIYLSNRRGYLVREGKVLSRP